MQFGDVLKKLRKEKGMTQRELANEMRISHSSIGLYEQNRREPEYELLCKFADFFNTDIDYLLGRTLKNKKENADSRKAKKHLERLQRETTKIENELSEIDEEMNGEAAYDYNRLSELDIKKNELEERLLEIYEELEGLI